jgi:peroxin-3
MSLLLGGSAGLGNLVAELESGQGGIFGEGTAGGNEKGEEGISEEVENKYLTMSWWMLHVGWKDVRERVRRGVEEVFDGYVLPCPSPVPSHPNHMVSEHGTDDVWLGTVRVSLKTKLGVIDLHRLISDVRRRVEYEVTFEGRERRIEWVFSAFVRFSSFLRSLLHRPLFLSFILIVTILSSLCSLLLLDYF